MRMYALVVIHRRLLYENVDSAKIKATFHMTDIDILRVASMHRIVIHCIDISIHIDESLHPYQTPTWTFSWMITNQLCLLRLWDTCFGAAHVDESEGRPSSCFRCEHCHSLKWAATKHALLKLHWRLPCETGVKHIQICIHAAAGPERATQSFQPHIIISMLHI